jgi:hypothetical protein
MRFLAWIFLILTVVAVVYDWRAIPEDGEFVLRPLGTLLSEVFGPSSVTLIQSSIERHVSPDGIFEPYILPLLLSPAAIVFGIAFLIFHVLAALFRRPRGHYNDEPL